MNDDATIQDLYRKIEKEKSMITAANKMRQATQNPQLISRAESQIRDAQRHIQYFEQTLHDLRTRQMGRDMGNMSVSGNGAPSAPPNGSPDRTGQGRNNQQGYNEGSDYGNPGPGGYSGGGAPGQMPARGPYAPPGPTDRTPRARPNFSKLGTYSAIWCTK